MSILVTGAAGFIGMHVSTALLARGETVVGLDNMSPYYDVTLKRDRLARLSDQKGFTFVEADIATSGAVASLVTTHGVTRIIHLAAQAGVRHSIDHPEDYIQTNLVGHFNVLEAARHADQMVHLVYASSSSVYGANKTMPFSIDDRVDHPVSLYAATKKSDELMSHCYAHLYGLPITGLRFFTVYGPWGRPDMSAFLFTRAILNGEPIRVFNHGKMQRDFTYIDDIVAGVISALDRPPVADAGMPPHKVYNLGNNTPEALMDFIAAIEAATGKPAAKHYEDMQPGDVPATYADIEATHRDLGFQPTTPIAVGIPRFVAWYRDYYGV